MNINSSRNFHFHFLLISVLGFIISNCENFYGKLIGKFPANSLHKVSGTLYAANENTFILTDFNYDGAGPDAHFWAGASDNPRSDGLLVPDEFGRDGKLEPYTERTIIVKLPPGKKIHDFRYFSVWCRKFSANFGHINIPSGFTAPKEVNVGRIPTRAHSTSADAFIIKDIKTVKIINLRYDGAGPDAFFLVGKGNINGKGTKVPDENGSIKKLHGYQGEDITLRLPDGLTIHDIEWFALYCILYSENFGELRIPKDANVPPDLNALQALSKPKMENCQEFFDNKMQVSWKIFEEEIYFNIDGQVQPNTYLSFGISGNPDRNKMEGADVAVVYFNKITQKPVLDDYILFDKSQCNPPSNSGACPDNVISGAKSNLKLISSSYVDRQLSVLYSRPFNTGDEVADKSISKNSDTVLVAGIGLINSRNEVAYHSIAFTSSRNPAIKVRFNKNSVTDNCASRNINNYRPGQKSANKKPFKPVEIRNVETFRAVIGPTGGDRGYNSITGIVGWGICWWINGEMLPAIHVKRGHNYTFIVEGGNDPSNNAEYHPFYITDSQQGGGSDIKIGEPKLNTTGHKIFAGVDFVNGRFDSSEGTGRYCEFKHNTIDKANQVSDIEEYKNTLHLECKPGQAGSFVWTPDENTPSVVYYQCFTHRNLGWKILVDTSAPLTPISLALLLVMQLALRCFNV